MEQVELQTQRVSAVLACFTNLFLLHLIVHHSPKHIGIYKYFMVYICVFEILYAVLDVLISPRIFLKDCTFLIIVDSKKTVVPKEWVFLADVLYCDFFGTSMAIFAIHFIYRYLVVSGSKILAKFRSCSAAVLLLLPFVFGSIWTVTVYFTLQPTAPKEQFLREQFPDNESVVISDLVYLGPYFYPKDETGRETVDWHSFAGVATISFMLSVSLSIMVVFGVMCYRKMSSVISKSSGSSHFKSLQSQLFYALVFQTAIPLTLMHIPCAYVFFSAFLSRGTEFLGHVLSITIALYPVLDPLPNMFIIKNYRNAVLKCRLTGRKNADIPVTSQIPMSMLDVDLSRSALSSARSAIPLHII